LVSCSSECVVCSGYLLPFQWMQITDHSPTAKNIEGKT
jgi:hypothetical protein